MQYIEIQYKSGAYKLMQYIEIQYKSGAYKLERMWKGDYVF